MTHWVCLVLALTALMAGAAEERSLLVRQAFPGNIQPPWNKIMTKCEITTERILISRTVAGTRTEEVRALKIEDVSALDALVLKAAAGSFDEKQGPTSGPFVNYFARKADGQSVTLRKRDPYAVVVTNTSHEAESLMHFLNAHCPPVTDLQIP